MDKLNYLIFFITIASAIKNEEFNEDFTSCEDNSTCVNIEEELNATESVTLPTTVETEINKTETKNVTKIKYEPLFYNTATVDCFCNLQVIKLVTMHRSIQSENMLTN